MFEDQRKTGRLDLEAVEMAMRAAMHRAGASALSQLLRGDPPGPDEREVPCPCGHKARVPDGDIEKVLGKTTVLERLGPHVRVRIKFTGYPCADGIKLNPGSFGARVEACWHQTEEVADTH